MSDASSHKPALRPPDPGSTSPHGGDGSRGSSSASGTSDPQMTVISGRAPVPALSIGRMTPLESGSLLEGERLGQFLLQKFIGGGGMGVVFRALDTTLNRDVAVKVLSRDQASDEEALRRFRNEAQSAARLNHDNIARVHYVGEDRGVHYIVFEFIEGVNLRDRVEQQGPLPLEEAVSYTFQIAQALDHASQRDVIHRDIKPSNVLITPDGKAKLVDMGLARLNQVAHVDNELTASGVTLGTFDYISPEQARDPRSADVRSDLYSLGCSFFYMLTGRPPFPDGTVLQKLLQHQADHPPDPRTLRPELPMEVTWILARLLAKNPAQRFQRPDELLVQLAALGDKLGLQLRSPTVWVRPQSETWLARWRHHLPWAVPLAALFLIVLALDYAWSPARQSNTVVGRTVPNSAAPRPRVPTNRSAPVADPVPEQPEEPASKTPAPDGEGSTVQAPAEPSDPPADDTSEEPNTAGVSSPWLRRLAKSFGAQVNVEELAAGARAAKSSGSNAAPSVTDDAAGAAVSGADAQPVDATAAASANNGVARDGVLIVSDTKTGDRVYSSLHAACSNAKSGDTIELHFNKRLTEAPIQISNIKLTIRAGDGCQPVVVFRPEPNPVKYPPSMITVAGGQFRAVDVHWELDLPRNMPGDWVLVETQRAELLQFENCSLTIRNASLGQTAFHTGVAFFHIKAAPGTGGMAMDPNAVADEQIVTIDLKNCVVRGEAALVRDNELQPVNLHWDNGLLATSEQLLVAAGGPTRPRQLGYVRINLRHVTAMLHGGLALLTNSEDAPYQLYTEFKCNDSILATGGNPPLIAQRGPDSVEQYMSRVEWSGQRDFFDGVNTFWRIVNGTTQTKVKELDFGAWQEFWAAAASSMSDDEVAWKGLPEFDRPFHLHTPADYALDTAARRNAAIGGASDGLDAGCLDNQLPPLPAEPTDGAGGSPAADDSSSRGSDD